MDTEGCAAHYGQVSASSSTICACMCKHRHWIAVFGLVMDRYSRDTLQKLIQHTKSRHSECQLFVFLLIGILSCTGAMSGKKEVQSFISCAIIILKAFPKRPRYLLVSPLLTVSYPSPYSVAATRIRWATLWPH